MTEQDPGRLADRRDDEADQLQDRSEQVQGHIDEVRQEWQQNRASASVPGANPPEPDEKEAENPGTD